MGFDFWRENFGANYRNTIAFFLKS